MFAFIFLPVCIIQFEIRLLNFYEDFSSSVGLITGSLGRAPGTGSGVGSWVDEIVLIALDEGDAEALMAKVKRGLCPAVGKVELR